jgi:(E)-4-hydroxy-3-methylbut-2-enyl-diphosphate synthase
MGCAVNGPGEAREADIALAGGRDKFALYVGGVQVKVVPQADAVQAVMDAVRVWRKPTAVN